MIDLNLDKLSKIFRFLSWRPLAGPPSEGHIYKSYIKPTFLTDYHQELLTKRVIVVADPQAEKATFFYENADEALAYRQIFAEMGMTENQDYKFPLPFSKARNGQILGADNLLKIHRSVPLAAGGSVITNLNNVIDQKHLGHISAPEFNAS